MPISVYPPVRRKAVKTIGQLHIRQTKSEWQVLRGNAIVERCTDEAAANKAFYRLRDGKTDDSQPNPPGIKG
jgi:hypothetical protein